MNTGYLLMNISKQMKYQLNQALLQQGLTVQQWAVIQQLAQQIPLTAVTLSARLDMDKPTLSGIIKRLLDKQLIEKTSNPDDKRSQLLSLTDAGMTAAAAGKQTSDDLLDHVLGDLSPAEQATLNHLLTKINASKETL
ncbi:MarR family winged helix-turn-helix transcriptional regulator [Lacticaseibacillus saniviri]